MWDKVSSLLDKKIQKRGAASALLSSRVCYIALKIGEDLFKPISFRNGILLVLVSDSASATSLQLSQEQIMEKINQKLGQEIVKKIRVRVENF